MSTADKIIQRLGVYGMVALILWTGYGLLHSPAPDLAWAERNQEVVARAARTQRLRADSASNATTRVLTRVVTREAGVDTSLAVVRSDAEAARKLLADSSATLAEVRESYCLTLARVDVLVADVSAYKGEVVALRDTLATERLEMRRAVSLWADSVPKANQAVLNAYKAELRKQRLKTAGVLAVGGFVIWRLVK